MPFYHKQLRLPTTNYIGPRTHFVTIVTAHRSEFFAHPPTGHWLVKKLLETAARQNFLLHAYCAMPDHVHFLAEGMSQLSNLTKFVDAFKQVTAHEFTATRNTRLWQKRHYDHILRRSEPLESPACYIWANPLRKNLCTAPHEYPFSGSQTIEWMKAQNPAKPWQPPWKPT